ncbi:Uma2 family endonuclease [Aquabacterium sp. A7-Y]|uniref:Uma2 family endonuclease n=1 Tax=Aquabacterium sp. A7-Y TaxID=1349605 RepID=UPI00223E69CB|nr:Uma2 family endonuclease [Aquabacterium sp. A7-Y]MCW7537343.1 Uma2 family endonuclease [Aquabacterium sp. A7-Y]
MSRPLHKSTVAEYLAWEEQQAERHEFFRGEVFAMVGNRRGHGRVVANLMRHLGNHLDDSPCQALSENMKVRVGDEAVLYPDVFVTCDRHYGPNEIDFTAPVVIIEVLSPSTQRWDRSEKFATYRKLPSLREYALIDPDTRRVEVFRPQSDRSCLYFDMTEQHVLALASIGFELSCVDLFKGMESNENNPPP